jgi:XTP/dITP diphosphohydrolase
MATANPNKIKEINEILENTDFNVISMLETGYEEEIEETGLTLEENALIKARVLHQELGEDVFSEDTGLEVDALNGLPGVKTARFAGEDKDPRKNMSLLLEKLKGIDDRSAQFRTCIALILGNKEYLFEGKVRGSISNELQGEGGFGYDPIFIPEGFDRTFGQLSSKIKNEISHRKRAMDQLVEFLEKNQ